MNGYGRFIYTNGDYYLGTFLNHKKHGFGKYIQAKTGAITEGEWANDKFAPDGLNQSYSQSFLDPNS